MKKLIKLFSIVTMAAAGVFGIVNALNRRTSLVESSMAVGTGQKVYLDIGTWGGDDKKKYAAYFFNDSTSSNTWKLMDEDGALYSTTVPSGYPNVIFCRMNPAGGLDWGSKWNQTANLDLPSDSKNLYTVDGWDGSSNAHWSTTFAPGRYLVGSFAGGFEITSQSVLMTAGENDDMKATGISLTKGQTIKSVYYNGKVRDYWGGYSSALDGSDQAKWCFTNDSDDNYVCQADGSYSFYYKDTAYDGIHKMSVASDGNTASQLALKLHNFDYQIEVVEQNINNNYCLNSDRFPAVQSFYNDMSSSEKTKFNGYASLSDNYYKPAFDRYNAWETAYNAHNTTSQLLAKILPFSGEEGNGLVPIIVIISLVSVTAIGGFFFIKKRKETN